MNCPKCGAELPEDAKICSSCQTPVEEQTPAQEPQVEQQASTEQEPQAEPQVVAPEVNGEAAFKKPEAKKNNNLPLILAMAAVIIVLAVLVAVLGSRNSDDGQQDPAAVSEQVETEQAELGEVEQNEAGFNVDYTEADLDAAVAYCESQGYSVTNQEFNYYYWGEYYYIVAAYGDVISYYFDTTKPLSEQAFDDTMSWQDYLIEGAISSVIQTKGLVFEARSQGFEMPEESRAALESTLLDLQNYAQEYEYESVDAYIAASYGDEASFESFSSYLEESYYSSAYTDQVYENLSFTDEEIEAYFDQYAADYEASGITKDETMLADVRHILVLFETDEEGNVSDEANAAAKEEAQSILDQWQANGADEEAFIALTADNSDDPGTASNGGLCANVAPGETVAGFNDWVFAEGRAAGDCELVETELGWHLIYYIAQGDYRWRASARADIAYETLYATVAQIAGDYTFQVDKGEITIYQPTDVSAGFVTEEETAEDLELTPEGEAAQAEAPVETDEAVTEE